MENQDRKVTEQNKKQYVKPEIVYQQALEVMAAFCDQGAGGKSGTSVPACTVISS